MFRIPRLAEFGRLFLRPTVERAIADVNRTVERLKEAEAHAVASAKRHAADIRRAEERIAGSRALRDFEHEVAERAKRVARRIGELVA